MSSPGRFLDLPSGRVHAHRRDGARTGKPPLVLLHGYLVSHRSFRPVLEPLEEHFDVIALDLPGYGESDRPAPGAFSYGLSSLAEVVVQAMSAMDVDRAHLLGHSMGGGVALTLAAEHPERVHRLVAEDAAIYPGLLPLEGRLALVPVVGQTLFRRLYGRRDLRRVLRAQFRDPELVTTEDVDFYWERLERPGGRAAAYAGLQVLASLDENTAIPARVRAPTLIVWGEEDAQCPLAHGRRLARQLVDAALDIVPACAHVPHEERPAELLRSVVPFLLRGERTAAAAS